jgi:hypothetical protein
MDHIVKNQIITIFILRHAVNEKRPMPSNRFHSMENINFLVLHNLFDRHISCTIDTDTGFAISVNKKTVL